MPGAFRCTACNRLYYGENGQVGPCCDRDRSSTVYVAYPETCQQPVKYLDDNPFTPDLCPNYVEEDSRYCRRHREAATRIQNRLHLLENLVGQLFLQKLEKGE